jgi:hypothetical protein
VHVHRPLAFRHAPLEIPGLRRCRQLNVICALWFAIAAALPFALTDHATVLLAATVPAGIGAAVTIYNSRQLRNIRRDAHGRRVLVTSSFEDGTPIVLDELTDAELETELVRRRRAAARAPGGRRRELRGEDPAA